MTLHQSRMRSRAWRSDYDGGMEISDHNPYRSPTVAPDESISLGSIVASMRSWIANLTGWQLLLAATGCGLFAVSVSSFMTAELLRHQFLTEQQNNVAIDELMTAPLLGLASAFLGACFVISSWQQRRPGES